MPRTSGLKVATKFMATAYFNLQAYPPPAPEEAGAIIFF
jgi:hypothetical protein